MPATYLPIYIEKRACYEMPLILSNDDGTPYNLSGVILTGQVRRDFDNFLQGSFHYEVLNSGTASVKLSLSSDVTAGMEVALSSYDIFLDTVGSSCAERILYGPATISGNITI